MGPAEVILLSFIGVAADSYRLLHPIKRILSYYAINPLIILFQVKFLNGAKDFLTPHSGIFLTIRFTRLFQIKILSQLQSLGKGGGHNA